MIDKYRLMLWLAFENSGQINDYLKYKIVERMDFEAGEGFGFNQDFRNSSKDNKIR